MQLSALSMTIATCVLSDRAGIPADRLNPISTDVSAWCEALGRPGETMSDEQFSLLRAEVAEALQTAQPDPLRTAIYRQLDSYAWGVRTRNRPRAA